MVAFAREIKLVNNGAECYRVPEGGCFMGVDRKSCGSGGTGMDRTPGAVDNHGRRHDMGTPEVWFAIPSASPEKCRKVLPVWKKMGYKTAVLQNFEHGEIPADICVWYDSYPGWPKSVNILSREIVPKGCPIVVSGGDDMLPDPNHTAQELAAQFLERFPDTFGVMQPHGDEYLASRRYCGSPFLGRAWIDTMYGGTGPMFAGYHHNWADNELYWVAKGLGALWDRPDLSHYHDHFTREGQQAPAYWSGVKMKDLDDCLLYYARAQTGFAGHEPVPGAGARRFDEKLDRKEMVVLAKQRLMGVALDNPYADAINSALKKCAELGQDPVGIYGLGAHTRIGAPALCQPPVRVACIIDDNAAHQGKMAWNIPVVSPTRALELGVKGVVLSAAAVEDELWERAVFFRDAGVAVHRLYGAASEQGPARHAGTAAIASKTTM